MKVGAFAMMMMAAAAALAGCAREAAPIPAGGPTADWRFTGGAEGGGHYSPLTRITPQNVRELKPAWTYHIGMMTDAPAMSSPTFEATPIVVDDRMYTCSGLGKIVSLDPETGKQIWAFDAKADPKVTFLLNCRGVAYWKDPAPRGPMCAGRIVAGTVDGKLLTLDAATGRPCTDFGQRGSEDLEKGLGSAAKRGDYGIPSSPVVIDDLVVVGGRIPDNMRIDMPAGVIRAFDVRSGALKWAWNPIPPGRSDDEARAKGEPYLRGTPNAWAPLSIDAARHLIFVPTGNAGPDHVGITRHGLDYFSSSVVALDSRTGEVRWRFQTVHHDLWDYDVPSQPTLFDLRVGGRVVPALAQSTKQGHIFILNRETGQPIYPVVERPVPAGSIPGETYAPTQPYPANPAFIVRRTLSEKDIWGVTPWDRGKCRDLFRSADWKGTFTPPSTRGFITFPSFMGATNWGGVAIDPVRQIMIVNTTQVPALLKLIPRAEADARMAKGEHMLPAMGAAYANTMQPMLSPFGAPCISPPWGTLTAIDLAAGKRLWEVPLGTTRDQAPTPFWFKWGVPNLGGSVVTASGLAFIGATTDAYIRAYDVRTGQVLWRARLPGGGQATPMSFRLKRNGRQYVVIAAGGHKYLGTKMSDTLVAFAL